MRDTTYMNTIIRSLFDRPWKLMFGETSYCKTVMSGSLAWSRET